MAQTTTEPTETPVRGVGAEVRVRCVMSWENTPQLKISFHSDETLPHPFEILVEADGFGNWGGAELAGDSPQEALGLLFVELCMQLIAGRST